MFNHQQGTKQMFTQNQITAMFFLANKHEPNWAVDYCEACQGMRGQELYDHVDFSRVMFTLQDFAWFCWRSTF